MACYIEFSVIDFIDENGGGPGVRLRKQNLGVDPTVAARALSLESHKHNRSSPVDSA
jgi:hypothetical protein